MSGPIRKTEVARPLRQVPAGCIVDRRTGVPSHSFLCGYPLRGTTFPPFSVMDSRDDFSVFCTLSTALHLLVLTNNDIWWHLRTGLWILEDHAIPRSGIFSQWPLFLGSIRVGDSMRLRRYSMASAACGTSSPADVLAGGDCSGALRAVLMQASFGRRLLSLVAQFCLMPIQPRPALCSIILLAVELVLLLRARRTGDARALYWLPLVFVAVGESRSAVFVRTAGAGAVLLARMLSISLPAIRVAWFEDLSPQCHSAR